jgi:type VI secretion system protein ImpK
MLAEPLTADAAGARAVREAPRRRGELALALQEAFTVAVRLRTRRQVSADAQSFRMHVKQLLSAVDAQARHAGYDANDVRLALYAYVAFLDESVLNSGHQMFADWPRQPLQEEVFGDHVAGENFFRHLRELMGRQDSEELADLLEVFQLCLLLGFRGKFAADPGGLHAVLATVQEKIRRIRGGPPPLSPAWALPQNEPLPAARDPWMLKLLVTAGAAAVIAIVLFILFRLSLGSGLAELGALPGAQ